MHYSISGYIYLSIKMEKLQKKARKLSLLLRPTFFLFPKGGFRRKFSFLEKLTRAEGGREKRGGGEGEAADCAVRKGGEGDQINPLNLAPFRAVKFPSGKGINGSTLKELLVPLMRPEK